MQISLEKIRKILNFYELLEKNIIDGKQLEEIYKILPIEHQSTVKNNSSMIQAIRTFVIMNYLEIQSELQPAPTLEEVPLVESIKEIDEIKGEAHEVYKTKEEEKTKTLRQPKRKPGNKTNVKRIKK